MENASIIYKGQAYFIRPYAHYFKSKEGVYMIINEHGIVTVCDRNICWEPIDMEVRVSSNWEVIEWDEFMKGYKETQFKIDQVLTLI